ncbi:MAG: DUF72 domain-containing protein [Candidatus Aminicenantales bacterium]
MIYHLGTSGWSYAGWREIFYPAHLAQKDWLSYYSEHFNTVEINMTFYRFPRPETLKGWLKKTPADFKFTLKANRRITHIKKLKDVQPDVKYFTLLAENLEEKLGCLLFQLPPSITMDLKTLEEFLSTLSPLYKNVIEFRHESWYTEEVFELLRSRQIIFCIVSSSIVPKTVVSTTPIAYFRFHGLTGGYRYNYRDEELKEWAESIKDSNAEECFAYFNNDYKAYAVYNSKRLGELLEKA